MFDKISIPPREGPAAVSDRIQPLNIYILIFDIYYTEQASILDGIRCDNDLRFETTCEDHTAYHIPAGASLPMYEAGKKNHPHNEACYTERRRGACNFM